MRSRIITSTWLIASPRLTIAIAIVATSLLTLRLSLEDSKLTPIVGMLRPITLAIGLGLSVVAVLSSIASFPIPSPHLSADDDTP